MKKITLSLSLIGTALTFLFLYVRFSVPAFAQALDNPLSFNTLREFLEAILNVIVTIAFPVVVVMVIYTGFLFVTARGNEQKLSTAKTALVWTLVGAMIVLGAFVLANAISGTVDEISR